MDSEFIAYKKLTDLQSAEEISNELTKNGIECHLQDDMQSYVKVVGYNQINPGVTINIKSQDFSKADKILDAYFSAEISDVDKDYYLFQFSDEELKEIIANPQEWGIFDFQLAKKLLETKGVTYSEEYFDSQKQTIIKTLSKIKKISLYKLVLGYLLAFLFPPAGMLNGFLILNNRNILPDGKKFYLYSEKDRMHGKVILTLSIIWLSTLIVGSIVEQS